jgi:O-antigen/teichoic acid export membrane protein
MAVICAFFGFFAEPFVRIAFGVEYLPAVSALQLALPAAFFLGLISVTSQFLAALGIPWQLLVMWLGAVGTIIGLSLTLIPRFASASAGASASLSITYALTFLAVFGLAYFMSLRLKTAEAKEIL